MAVPASPYVGEHRRVFAVDSDAATCNHAIHEFFEYTFHPRFLVAPLAARGRRVECESLSAASIQAAFLLARQDRGKDKKGIP
ncbi:MULTISPECIES: hypothetical protein [unclassified Massilia]|uniref:hypothetical protein n=1 Tax=unclassified Massilia TaxID=2609279 RepID=UPI0012E17602|nr:MULTISPECIES: hypothetical protein [unclassified Massilia]